MATSLLSSLTASEKVPTDGKLWVSCAAMVHSQEARKWAQVSHPTTMKQECCSVLRGRSAAQNCHLPEFGFRTKSQRRSSVVEDLDPLQPF